LPSCYSSRQFPPRKQHYQVPRILDWIDAIALLRHAEYLGSWLSILKQDTKAIFTAAAKATEAAQFLEAAGGLSVAGDVEEAA
jgi:antirestriction protein ArdC